MLSRLSSQTIALPGFYLVFRKSVRVGFVSPYSDRSVVTAKTFSVSILLSSLTVSSFLLFASPNGFGSFESSFFGGRTETGSMVRHRRCVNTLTH